MSVVPAPQQQVRGSQPGGSPLHSFGYPPSLTVCHETDGVRISIPEPDCARIPDLVGVG